MDSVELKQRLKRFSLRIIKLSDSLPKTHAATAIAKQISRSGTSPGANYRAACIAKSEKDFLNKLKMVEEELDETIYWIELIIEAEMLPAKRLADLHEEAEELYKIIIASLKTTREHLNSTVQGK